MTLSLILSFISVDWGLQRPLVVTLIAINILLVILVNPYEQYAPREPDNLDAIEKKWFDRFCFTLSGNFLDLLSLVSILISYTALDYRDNYIVLQLKSLIIGLANLFICIYFMIFVLLEDRLTLFPKLSRILGWIEKFITCNVCMKTSTVAQGKPEQPPPYAVLSEAGVPQQINLDTIK